MAFPFRSKFAGNKKLEACAVNNPDHIGESFASQGPWVNLIQEALNTWAASYNQTRRPDQPEAVPVTISGTFDKKTGDLVALFKSSQRPPLLNYKGMIDRIVGIKTVRALDDVLAPGNPQPSPQPPPEIPFICGPDVTEQIAAIWEKIQKIFHTWTPPQKLRACNKIFIPLRDPNLKELLEPGDFSLETLKNKVRMFADINAFDTLPLFWRNSQWLRRPPVFDPALNGPCATPGSTAALEDFSAAGLQAHENPAGCSNTVQVAGKCWLAGSVNYGTLGIMVKLCEDFAADSNPLLRLIPGFNVVRKIYTIEWAEMLIKAYKTHGAEVEAYEVPIAWTRATYNGGPRGTPSIPGNRPKCKCNCNCKGDIVTWDFVWEPIKPRSGAVKPEVGLIE